MTKTVVLTVPDISCGHCVATVTGALTPVPGVRSVDVDLPTRKVTVEYDAGQADVERFKAALAAEDYPVAAAEPAGV
jgi:copper chaperone